MKNLLVYGAVAVAMVIMLLGIGAWTMYGALNDLRAQIVFVNKEKGILKEIAADAEKKAQQEKQKADQVINDCKNKG